MSKQQSFNDILLDSIDDGLSVLGNEPKQAVYQYLSSIHALYREQIPERVDDFAVGMRKALGSASKVIERLILKKLFQRLGSPFKETSGLEFPDYVIDARRRFEITSAKHNESLENLRSKKSQVPGQ